MRGPLELRIKTQNPKEWDLYFEGRKITRPAPKPFWVLACMMVVEMLKSHDMLQILQQLNYNSKPTNAAQYGRHINGLQRCISELRKKLKDLCGRERTILSVYSDASNPRKVTGYKLVWPL